MTEAFARHSVTAWSFMAVTILIWMAAELLLSSPLRDLPGVSFWALQTFLWTTSALTLVSGCLHARLGWKALTAKVEG